MFNPIRNFGSADDVLKRAEKRQQEEEERRKRAAGPVLPSGSPTLKNVVSANSKEALYVRKDDDLTPDQIIRKYQFVADDTSMDYDRKSQMIKEGQKSLSRIRDREIFQDILGTPETNYRPQIADLSARLSAQTKRTAFGSGFGRAAGLDTYQAAVERLAIMGLRTISGRYGLFRMKQRQGIPDTQLPGVLQEKRHRLWLCMAHWVLRLKAVLQNWVQNFQVYLPLPIKTR